MGGLGRGRSWSNQHIRRVIPFLVSFYWEYLVRDQNTVVLVQLSFTKLVQEVGEICSTIAQINLCSLRTEFHMCFSRKLNLFSYGFVIFANNCKNRRRFYCHKIISQNTEVITWMSENSLCGFLQSCLGTWLVLSRFLGERQWPMPL